MPISLPWDDWEITKVIGRGASGTVYEIQKNHFGITESAAVKILSIPEIDDEGDQADESAHFKNLIAEYSTMLKLRGHGNIVYCDDVKCIRNKDNIGWDIFIKMELLTALNKVPPTEYNEDEVIRLGKDLCSALVYCHQQKIYHQDIKPQNIFVSNNGTYKLGDFGIAQRPDLTVYNPVYGLGIGTPEYMPPDTYRHNGDASRVDIYALGLVMYWMMNQRYTPFLPSLSQTPTGSDKANACNRRMRGDPLPPPINGTKWLKEIVLKACSFNPNDCYASAQDLLNALNGSSSPPPPPDLDVHINMTFERKNHPAGKSLSIRVDGKEVHFSVPIDVKDGQEISLPGKGKHDRATGTVGNLYITIHINEGGQDVHLSKYIIIAAIFVVVALLLLIPRNSPPPPPPQGSAPTIATNPPVPQHQHDWKDATYNSPKTCITCGKTEGSKKAPSSRLHLADIIAYTSASSVMSGGDEYLHNPENLYDNDKLTNWTEGTSGAGIGEYVTLYFDDTYAIKEFTILTGSHYQKDSSYFEKNNRPSAITLYFSDGSSEYIQLDDTRNYQTFTFPEYRYADYVEIIIEDVYAGTDWNDTIIAEVDFAAYLP